MSYDHAKSTYRRLHRDVQDVVGRDFRVPLVVGDPDQFPRARNMAYCMYRDGNAGREIDIVAAPKLLRGHDDRIEAIFRHELAHAIEFHVGEHQLREMAAADGHDLPRGAERRADRVAEIIWGDPIYYDEILVQTLGRGIRPRPRHLGL